MADSGKNTLSIVIMMILTIGLIGGGTLSYIQSTQIVLLQEDINRLQNEVNSLQGNYTNLENEYNDLVSDHDTLMDRYGSLYNNFTQLQGEYENLTESYEELLENYNSLFADYESLKAAFEDPLDAPVIPTISEVRDWLEIDDTDQCEYVTDVWMCGDFAAMLMTRAKAMNWRMRIVTVHYSYEGEIGYGSLLDVYGSGGHAFNLIECTDGIWYIEPQNDGRWYFTSGGTRVLMHIHGSYTFSSGNTIWDGYTIWTNFYGYFG